MECCSFTGSVCVHADVDLVFDGRELRVAASTQISNKYKTHTMALANFFMWTQVPLFIVRSQAPTDPWVSLANAPLRFQGDIVAEEHPRFKTLLQGQRLR